MILRDYGLYDHAMLRFKSGHKIQDNFYKRQDGTRAYYFTVGMFNLLVSIGSTNDDGLSFTDVLIAFY